MRHSAIDFLVIIKLLCAYRFEFRGLMHLFAPVSLTRAYVKVAAGIRVEGVGR